MNELHLNNPQFLRHVRTLEQEITAGTIWVELNLPIVGARRRYNVKRFRHEVLFLVTHDNICSKNMVWQPSPMGRYQFSTFDCIDIYFLYMTRGIKYVDKKRIFGHE
jgi:hypothetical protein